MDLAIFLFGCVATAVVGMAIWIQLQAARMPAREQDPYIPNDAPLRRNETRSVPVPPSRI